VAHSFQTILVDRPEPAIARITLNRPQFLNAYNHQLCEEVTEAIEAYLRDDSQRCLIITGAGRGFCSGGDISGAEPSEARMARLGVQLGRGVEMRDGFHRVVLALSRCDKPVIAMVNGPCVAGGLALALACDFRIASDRAKLGDTSGKFGLLPDEGGAWLFPRAMGMDKALKMSLLAEVYDAHEAERLGLVTSVVPHDELEARTLDFARRLAAQAPLAVRLAKHMMQRAQDISLERSLQDASLAVMIANPSDDVKEGRKAFVEKRPPKFQGR
jgi:2-(1,2-epoxy-1,2-dihydrophenyl)acetyl-CoA isomerase